MQPFRIQFTEDGSAQWAGMADLVLLSPDSTKTLHMAYQGEPPFGDSFHTARFKGKDLPGYFWGCMFAFSCCSRYIVGSWMKQRYERATAVFDLESSRYFVLPDYLYDFRVSWPVVTGVGAGSDGFEFTFTGRERWTAY